MESFRGDQGMKRNGPHRSRAGDPFRFFDVVYCINLDTRPDRWQQAMGEFVAIGLADRVERVAAITHADPREGCRRSHLECVKRAAAAGAETALIFEDDVVFPHFSPERLGRSLDRLRTIPDWDLFYLGGVVLSRPTERYGGLFRAPMAQSHAYAIHRRAFTAVERSRSPFDLWCAQTLKSYCAQPLLAWQRDGLSDIDGVLASRAGEARNTYARFVVIPDAEYMVRELVRRRWGLPLRVRLHRRVWRSLVRGAERIRTRLSGRFAASRSTAASPQPQRARGRDSSTRP